MSDSQIRPDKVTKPIQLLAAWLVGLILVNASFLLAAQKIENPQWAAGLLVIAAVGNVPVFIIALFVLQTKFRPQMQEDSFYAQYLMNERAYENSRSVALPSAEVLEEAFSKAAAKIATKLGAAGKGQERPIVEILRDSQVESVIKRFGHVRALSELSSSQDNWNEFVQLWGASKVFSREMDLLIAEGLVTTANGNNYQECSLTPLGTKVATVAAARGLLWRQKHRAHENDDKELPSKT